MKIIFLMNKFVIVGSGWSGQRITSALSLQRDFEAFGFVHDGVSGEYFYFNIHGM